LFCIISTVNLLFYKKSLFKFEISEIYKIFGLYLSQKFFPCKTNYEFVVSMDFSFDSNKYY
jgi:hypothetical protein